MKSTTSASSFGDIPLTIFAEVRQGSLIDLDETFVADRAVQRRLDWTEVEDSEVRAGSYFQQIYKAILPAKEALIVESAIQDYRDAFN